MTKQVRIENACTNTTKKIIVECWAHDPATDAMKFISKEELLHPTALMTETIWDGKELRIREE